MQLFAIIALILILARVVTELWLSGLNQRHVREHADEVPPVFRGIIDAAMYRRSIDYTLAKSRFGDIVNVFDTVVLIAVLFSGLLPWVFGRFSVSLGTSTLAMAGFLFLTGMALSIPGLPFAWYAQFKIEERFGFNTTRMKTWIADHIKGLLLALLLGYPLLLLVLKLIEWTGTNWWLWAAAVVIAFQLFLLFIAPAIIMPLFNKFTPLPEGELRQRLFGLAQRTHFPTRGIEVMDGSKRSRHSNAFFTGLGRFRKIVLFDTLIAQLTEPELESVLAHEIGHYKKRHVIKMLSVSIAGVVVAFAAIAWLARQQWFYRAFGFEYQGGFAAAHFVPAILLFAMLAGTISFWFSPLLHIWSRRFEYDADAFARVAMGESQSLIQALRVLTKNNLSNLTPHPLYSSFYYSHPTLLEREHALRAGLNNIGA
ncbi:MAG TPA: M48 family metallopeptidase [Candidatus Dormibacteraeota bacterium]|nr:M48 family metallopeptidase [Candidatus Dormibacteraeota bacterium]